MLGLETPQKSSARGIKSRGWSSARPGQPNVLLETRQSQVLCSVKCQLLWAVRWFPHYNKRDLEDLMLAAYMEIMFAR